MHIMYFTEQPMSSYPEDEGRKFGQTALMFSNKFFDPQEGSKLYNRYLEEYILAEEVGFDGIMLNEHHNAPFCMQAKTNIFASVLAAKTDRVKIVTLGNPLPLADNPIRVAEEIGMIDLISKGRLVPGIVRGGGQEQLAVGVNPAYNRERFQEAHDLLLKIWTEPGPFRWEGEHYQHRVVNPWVLPMQKPHPRIWVPGVYSKETIEWAAKNRYPYIALNPSIDVAQRIWSTYDAAAAEVGYTPGPENRGYLMRCHVAESEEVALRNARQFHWMQGEFTGIAHPVWSSPSGYFSPSARRQFVEFASGRVGARPNVIVGFEAQVEAGLIVCGTPDQVIKRLKHLLQYTRPGILSLWGSDGFVSEEDTKTCIRLLGQEVIPAIRDYGKELGLDDPWEADSPVSLRYSDKLTPGAVAKSDIALAMEEWTQRSA